MKAIYINLDPYLKAVALSDLDEDDGTYSPPLPSETPLPVAVTIPAAQDAAIALQTNMGSPISATIDGKTVYYCAFPTDAMEAAGRIASGYTPGLSAVAPSEQLDVYAVTENSFAITVNISQADDAGGGMVFSIPVLVRRETASGPVDLVDFTPPASGTPSAADIKSALVAAGDGALAGVKLGGAILMITGDEHTATKIQTDVPVEPGAEPVMVNDPKWANDNSFTLGGGAS